jgi:tetratricopeptide (TPR) repeat protein
MRRDSGDSKYQIEKFAKLLKSNQNHDNSFYQSFGLSKSELESKLQNHIKKGIIKPKLIKFKDRLTTKIKIENSFLERSEVLANLGDLLYQRGRFEESEKLLIEALKIDPESAFANSTLGLVRMKQNQFSEARKYFQKVNTANSQNYLTYYRFAYFLSREVITFDNYISNYSDERTLQMRRALQHSISLNPKFPDSYSLLAFINLVRNEDFDEGIKYLKKAIELDSRKETYQINLAKLYLRKNDYKQAQSIAETLYQNSPDDNLKKRAGDIIEEILFIQKKIKEENNLSGNLSVNSVFKAGKTAKKENNVLSEEDLERNRRQTQSEAISEVLIQPKADEKRIVGKISEVKCVGKKVVLTILSDNQIKKLRSIGFNNLLLKTFTSEMRGANFGCGTESKDVLAVMIYKPNLEKKDSVLGEIISIEFVPKNFVLSVNQ